jgi:hypothetical protein
MTARAARRRPAAEALALAVTGLALLAGCTSTAGPDDAAPSPSDTPRAAAAETGTCTDGFMLVDTGTGQDAGLETDSGPEADAEATIEASSPVAVVDSDCDLVSVVGSGGTVELGTVGTLVVEGTGVTVSVDEVTTVRLAGDDDVVTHGGAAPSVEDAGERNSVAPAA